MRAMFSGENRRAALMGAVGIPAILALLVFRLLSGGDSDVAGPVIPDRPSVTPSTMAAAPAAPAPALALPVDPALWRDPFCPLVGEGAVPGVAAVRCAPRTTAPGKDSVGLEDIFVEGGVRLARMHVGLSTFPNLRAGESGDGRFEVVSLAERCGEFVAGGAPFSLCEGEQTLK